MSGTRQTIQYSLALEPDDRGEARVSGHQGAEPFVAKPAPESPAFTLNPVEPPWYVTRMPGGVGGVAPRGVPLSRSMALMENSHLFGNEQGTAINGEKVGRAVKPAP